MNEHRFEGEIIALRHGGRGRVGQGNRRQGAAIIVALVCLALAVVLMTLVVKNAMMQKVGVRDEMQRVQADWLVDSGLQRAAARLAKDADYAGETWKIAPEVFGEPQGAVVLIEVAKGDEPARRTVRVRADFPDDPLRRVRQTREIEITLRPAKAKPSETKPDEASPAEEKTKEKQESSTPASEAGEP